MLQLTETQRRKFEHGLAFALARVDSIARQLEARDYAFHFSTHPDGSLEPAPGPKWGDGHWVGLLWLAYEATGDEKYLNWAKTWTGRIEPRQTDTWTHDLGFLLGLSHLKGYSIVHDPHYLEVALTAADYYTKRLNPKISLIQWHSTPDDESDNFYSVIDAMMNIALMWWASIYTGDRRYYDVGFAEAAGVKRYLVRGDFSTGHVIHYEPRTGRFIGLNQGQGYHADSCWARGHAWALYGYAHAYRMTWHKPFLDYSMGLADYLINHLPEDSVPYWDYNCPDLPDTYRDTSAASPYASGLFELALVTGDPVQSDCYRALAHRILESLTDHYLTEGTPHQGILLHGAQFVPKVGRHDSNGRENNCLVWGDYYYLEGILRALGKWSACEHF